jgi:hypothetical protein
MSSPEIDLDAPQNAGKASGMLLFFGSSELRSALRGFRQ